MDVIENIALDAIAFSEKLMRRSPVYRGLAIQGLRNIRRTLSLSYDDHPILSKLDERIYRLESESEKDRQTPPRSHSSR